MRHFDLCTKSILFPIQLYQSKIGTSLSATLLKSRYFLSNHHLTSVKIVNGVTVGVEDAKAGGLVVVLVSIPEDVHLVESLAGDGAPESLGVLDGSDLV